MPHRLRELGPQHHAAIRMRLEGVPTEQICEQLEIKPRTLYIWFSDPLVKAELAERQRRINELFAERVAVVASSALDELEAMVKGPTQGAVTPETKLKAIKEVLDRAVAAPDPCTELQSAAAPRDAESPLPERAFA
jgi:Homeodomain-like domain